MSFDVQAGAGHPLERVRTGVPAEGEGAEAKEPAGKLLPGTARGALRPTGYSAGSGLEGPPPLLLALGTLMYTAAGESACNTQCFANLWNSWPQRVATAPVLDAFKQVDEARTWRNEWWGGLHQTPRFRSTRPLDIVGLG